MKRFFVIILIFSFLGIAIYQGWPQKFFYWLGESPGFSTLFDRASSDRGLPDPLFGPLDFSGASLTQSGVIAETNQNREAQGLLPLKVDPALTRAAKAKLEDMEELQYFEHESPSGQKPADVIKAAGYDYLVVGENLALGNYKNDEVLVQAWMDSPGHRANILDSRFQEIGVAVKEVQYEGKTVWMAVQEFGTPLSACPQPSSLLKSRIDENQRIIEQEETALNSIKGNLKPENYPSRAEYEQAVNDYNDRVNKLNSLIRATKELVENYNNEVNTFNGCLESNG